LIELSECLKGFFLSTEDGLGIFRRQPMEEKSLRDFFRFYNHKWLWKFGKKIYRRGAGGGFCYLLATDVILAILAKLQNCSFLKKIWVLIQSSHLVKKLFNKEKLCFEVQFWIKIYRF